GTGEDNYDRGHHSFQDPPEQGLRSHLAPDDEGEYLCPYLCSLLTMCQVQVFFRMILSTQEGILRSPACTDKAGQTLEKSVGIWSKQDAQY
ncbi:mCG146099, partial [Mus musculus]